MARLTTVFLTFMLIGVAGFFATQKYILEPLHGTNFFGQTTPPVPAACLPPISNGCACATTNNCAVSGTCQRASCKKDFYNGNCVYPATQVPYIAFCYHSMTQCNNTEKLTQCSWKACRAAAPSNACSCKLDYPSGAACAGGATRVGGEFQTKTACNTFCSTLPPPPVQCGGTGTSCNGGTCPTGQSCTGAAGVACGCVHNAPPPPPPAVCGGTAPSCNNGTCPVGTTPPCTNINSACACCKNTGQSCGNSNECCGSNVCIPSPSGTGKICGIPPPPPPCQNTRGGSCSTANPCCTTNAPNARWCSPFGQCVTTPTKKQADCPNVGPNTASVVGASSCKTTLTLADATAARTNAETQCTNLANGLSCASGCFRRPITSGLSGANAGQGNCSPPAGGKRKTYNATCTYSLGCDYYEVVGTP